MPGYVGAYGRRSLLIILFLKNFPLRRRANHLYDLAPFRARKEGRIAIVTDVGRGMRWPGFALKTNTLVSDGEVVWS